MPIKLPSEDVIDKAIGRKAFGPGVLSRLEFGPELGRPFSPVRTRKAEELTSAEIARVRGDEVEEMRFLRCVAESGECFEMSGRQTHNAKILEVSSCSSRIRRSRGASSRGL